MGSRSEYEACVRCGVVRMVRERVGRPIPAICRDCAACLSREERELWCAA